MIAPFAKRLIQRTRLKMATTTVGFAVINRAQKIFRSFKRPPEPEVYDGEWSRDLTFVNPQDARNVIEEYKKNHPGALTFLDVGGGEGNKASYATGFEYSIMDIEKRGKKQTFDMIIGNICDCPEIPDDAYDVCFSNNVFEHLERPWDAARECVRITKPGGLLVHLAPFAWRYHPVPIDYYRFSHAGLAYLFEQDQKVERIIAGYDLAQRRDDKRGGKVEGGLDIPPIDEMGGWRENWETVYVARKL